MGFINYCANFTGSKLIHHHPIKDSLTALFKKAGHDTLTVSHHGDRYNLPRKERKNKSIITDQSIYARTFTEDNKDQEYLYLKKIIPLLDIPLSLTDIKEIILPAAVLSKEKYTDRFWDAFDEIIDQVQLPEKPDADAPAMI